MAPLFVCCSISCFCVIIENICPVVVGQYYTFPGLYSLSVCFHVGFEKISLMKIYFDPQKKIIFIYSFGVIWLRYNPKISDNLWKKIIFISFVVIWWKYYPEISCHLWRRKESYSLGVNCYLHFVVHFIFAWEVLPRSFLICETFAE